MVNVLRCNNSMLKKEDSVEVGVSGKYIHQLALVRLRLSGHGIHSKQVRDKISIYHLAQPVSGGTSDAFLGSRYRAGRVFPESSLSLRDPQVR